MEKLLLVEDNEHIMNINTKYLETQGYRIVQANTAARAEDAVRREAFDLIVMDIMLPDGNGIELCKDIRRYSACPILFLTAKVSDEDVINGLESGGDDYLTKPYDLDVLGARIRALLRRSKKSLPQNSSFSVGSLRFDIIKSQAFADNKELMLSAKEFGVLFYLAQNRSRKTPKEELYNAVWGASTDGDYTAVWTAVSRLNKKISDYDEQFYIDSDHNGYELVIISKGG